MATKQLIRVNLKLTQQDIAIMLKISRSQWALFEVGLRELSEWAFIRLSQIERFLLLDEMSEKKILKFEKHERARHAFANKALAQNKAKQYRCERKIEELKFAYVAAVKFYRLSEFLAGTTDERHKLHPAELAFLQGKAEMLLRKHDFQLFVLEKEVYMLQQEVLFLTQNTK